MSAIPPSRGGISTAVSPRPMTSEDNMSFGESSNSEESTPTRVAPKTTKELDESLPDESKSVVSDKPPIFAEVHPFKETFNEPNVKESDKTSTPVKPMDSFPDTVNGDKAGDRTLSQGIEHNIPGTSSMGRPSPSKSSYGRRGEGLQRPTTSGRPITARPTSAALRGAPSTASRLISTAAMQRPGTRTGVATGIGVNMQINVVDRPITRQGLSGMKTGARGPQRQFQDPTYFRGLLHQKINDLTTEIGRLGGEIESMKKEQSTFLTYDKRVKEMAQELTELQGSLSDYNLLLDLINTDTDKLDIDTEWKMLRDINDETANKLDNIFSQKQDLEKTMRDLENAIEEEKHMGESVINAMQPELKSRYVELRDKNSVLLSRRDKMQQEVDVLNQKKSSLEEELSMSQVKQESVGLYMRLQELQEKKNEIINENKARGSPEQERERLLQQVKDDNAEIATMERQISEVQDEFGRLGEEMQQADQELEENRSDRSQKYRELRKREETMETFLQSFEENKSSELQRLDELENNNVELLEKISRNLSLFGHLPSTRDFDTMRNELSFKEGELAKSRYTEQGLKQEHLALQSNLERIESLEGKIREEMIELKEKVRKMEADIVDLEDIEGLKYRAEEKRKMLIQEKEVLETKKSSVSSSLNEVKDSVETLKKQLAENDTYTQLKNLEKKWALLEQANYSIKDFVAQKRAESNYIPLKNQAMKLIADYNVVLQEVVQSGGIIA